MAEEKNIKQDNLVPIQDEIVLYQSEDGNIKVDVLFQDETVWLSTLAIFSKKENWTKKRYVGNSDIPLNMVLLRACFKPKK